MITDFLASAYPVTKALHIISIVSWMAGLICLPFLFAVHAEGVEAGSETDKTFQKMEWWLLRGIMNPGMSAAWVFGLALVFTPGIVSWSMFWPWTKAAAVLVLTWEHHWLALRRKDFAKRANTRSGRTYRMMNEVPTLALIVIVLSVIAFKYLAW